MQPDKKLWNNELRTLEKAPEGNKLPSAVLNLQWNAGAGKQKLSGRHPCKEKGSTSAFWQVLLPNTEGDIKLLIVTPSFLHKWTPPSANRQTNSPSKSPDSSSCSIFPLYCRDFQKYLELFSPKYAVSRHTKDQQCGSCIIDVLHNLYHNLILIRDNYYMWWHVNLMDQAI